MELSETLIGGESRMSQQLHKDDEGDVKERLGVLEAKLGSFQEALDNAWDNITELRKEKNELQKELQERDDRIDRLEDKIARLDARTDLLELVESANELDAEQRSTALIQHLKQAAERQRDREGEAMASVTPSEAEAALHHPDVDRTTIYTDMQRAVRLVGNENVLWYENNGYGNTRLKLNLEAGELPRKFTGRE